MKKVYVLILLCSGLIQPLQAEEEIAVLTVTVVDLYGNYIDNARVSISYAFPQDEDVEIPDQFTKRGTATFSVEAEREYVVTVTKAGFISYTETVELDEDTDITITLEYTQNVPILHMKRYSVSPQQVEPGEYFNVYVVLENEGTGDALNVKVTFDPAEYFSPVQPSSSAYFERVDVGDITSVNQSFVVSGEASSGVYDLVLTVVYADAAGSTHTVQETVGISILRKPLVKLLNVDYPEMAEQGEIFTFSVDVANTGRFAVNGIYIEVESDLTWEYSSYYIGSLEAGDFDTFVSEIMSEYPGEYTFVIKVGFVDDFNKEHYQEESFSVLISEKIQETLPPQEKGFWQKLIEALKSFLGLD